MKLITVIQARASSRRLPGKVLMPLCGKPILAHMVERVRFSAAPDVVVATSVEPSDDPVAGFCEAHGIACHRGSLNDVSKRFLDVAEARKADAMLRLCADSPLMDPRLIGQAVTMFREGPVDLVTNVRKRTFPKGQSIEIFTTQALQRAYRASDDPADREHVTPYFYRFSDDFRILSFEAAVLDAAGDCQLSVDTPDDFRSIEAIASSAGPALLKNRWQDWVRALTLREGQGLTP